VILFFSATDASRKYMVADPEHEKKKAAVRGPLKRMKFNRQAQRRRSLA